MRGALQRSDLRGLREGAGVSTGKDTLKALREENARLRERVTALECQISVWEADRACYLAIIEDANRENTRLSWQLSDALKKTMVR